MEGELWASDSVEKNGSEGRSNRRAMEEEEAIGLKSVEHQRPLPLFLVYSSPLAKMVLIYRRFVGTFVLEKVPFQETEARSHKRKVANFEIKYVRPFRWRF